MSYHQGRGGATHTGHSTIPKVGVSRGSATPAPRMPPQNFQPAAFRPVHPQQPPPLFPYEQQAAPPLPPPPRFAPPGYLPYQPHVAQAGELEARHPAIQPCPPVPVVPPRPARPPFPGPPHPAVRQGYPGPPCYSPAPPPASGVAGAPDGRAAGYHHHHHHHHLMPPTQPPPPLIPPQPVSYQAPYPLPSYSQHYPPPQHFGSGYPPGSPAPPSAPAGYPPGSAAHQHADHFRHKLPQQPPPPPLPLPQPVTATTAAAAATPYPAGKPAANRRSPERGRRSHHHEHQHHHHKERGYRSRGERRERGRSPERRRAESSRRRPSHDRVRSPPRHWNRDHSRDRHKHRDSYRSPSYERQHRRERKRTHSRSSSRERKRPRWEDERERRSLGHSLSKEKSHSAARSKEPEESTVPATIEEDKEEDELFIIKPVWIRCTHSENYYSSDPMDQVGDSTVVGTSKLRSLYTKFDEELGQRQAKAKALRPAWEPPRTKLDEEPDGSSSDSGCDSDGNSSGSSTCSSDSEIIDVIEEIKRKKAHPDRLHEELWYNDPGQMNDGPLCKCSAKAKRTGIRHSIYPGEETNEACRPMTNNAGKLFHYRITVSPPTNFLTDRPTVIEYDDHEYIFEGFSLFSHAPLCNIPLCKVIRFNIDYTIHFIEEMMPENFCVKGLEMFCSFLFKDILELYDWNILGPVFENGAPSCPRFHFLPRFVRSIPDSGKEVLSMHQVLLYLLRSSKPLVPEEEIANMLQWEELEWQKYAEECKGMIVTHPGMDLREVWLNYPLHPLQLQESNTDRPLIDTSPVLKKLTDFEETIGVNFIHIRLLARAFTLRTVGFNHLTLGHNQRMEFLGDSIMQLVATEYLFVHFPDHHEGHLTLLRSSLVNNRTQAKVAEELGMQDFAITNDKTKRPVALRTKTLADLLESFIAALYIDQDLDYVRTFMNVCFFPRLKEFILNQDWNDPKSQLQQCCLTLRTEGKEPDIPLYKILQTVGPSHARTYTVAVYFKGERIGCGTGPSIQQAEMGAAMDALEKYNFPQMAHQKRFIERKYRQELREMRRERERQEKEPGETEESRK
uniref:ribonuclease 3 n=1 Tax=Pristiophorus japonicus TaxID=55135 RepID=UPI00398F7C3D